MSTLSATESAPAESSTSARLPAWWPLAALTLLAAVLRLSTLNLQSFWYDEAFTPVHVLHPSLWATLRSVSHTENSPPLWYVLEWVDYRILGNGEIALRLPSAFYGIALVPVAWVTARELGGRAAAIACAALVACGPLFVWYSQEARVYCLFALTAAVALLCFLRALREPTARRMAAFALAGAVALATHYFSFFLLLGMALWMLAQPRTRRACIPALAVFVLVGAALIPLISAQGGHGTQWIGEWALSSRLQAIPQYYLTGYSGSPLGHGVELLVALPLLAAAGLGLWRISEAGKVRRDQERARRSSTTLVLWIVLCGVLIPIALALVGEDYLAPRNLLAAMVPLSVLLALLGTWPRTGAAGVALLALGVAALLAITIDVDLSPRLQRGDWRGVAQALQNGRPRSITTVELGGAPLLYYVHGARYLPEGSQAKVSEIDETGYAPLRASAGEPPAPGFHLVARLDVNGLIVYRFLASSPRQVSEASLRRHVITLAHPEVLIADPGYARAAR